MNTQFYAPDQQATSPQGASRTERRTATVRPVTPQAPARASASASTPASYGRAGRPAPSSPAWWPWSGSWSAVGCSPFRCWPRARRGAYGDVRTTALIVAVMAATLAATGLVQLLMIGTLRPLMFFGWIVALATTIIVVFPFSTTAPLDAKIATAVVNLAIGVAVGTLVGGVAARSSAPYDRISRH